MRLCFLTSMLGYPWAGSELLWTMAVDAAMEEGHEVAVVYGKWEPLPPAIADLQRRGARLFLRSLKQHSRPSRVFERLVHPLPAIVRWRPDAVCFSLGNFGDLVFRN